MFDRPKILSWMVMLIIEVHDSAPEVTILGEHTCIVKWKVVSVSSHFSELDIRALTVGATITDQLTKQTLRMVVLCNNTKFFVQGFLNQWLIYCRMDIFCQNFTYLISAQFFLIFRTFRIRISTDCKNFKKDAMSVEWRLL